jgi:CO/xanthine dehydrogenase Mo-binding subunit
MSQNQRAKTKIESKPANVVSVNLPMVRDFSTAGGHGPGDTIIEGDEKIPTKKWQGYPPQNLNLIGKPRAPMPEVAIPRYTGKAEFTTRVQFPNMLHSKLLTSPHPRVRIKSIDTSAAEKMPGVAHVLTYKNAPSTYPMPEALNFQGEVVAIVVADTEDHAEDAAEAIQVEYDVLPFASTLQQVMSPNAPQLRPDRPNLTTSKTEIGDVEKGFAESDIVKEFTYYFGGAVPVPMQPCGSVAKWDGEKVTVWGMGQQIHQSRDAIAKGLGIDAARVRFINKWSGGTFGGARQGSEKFYPWIAHIAKVTGRPTKIVMPKDHELAHIQVKPENITKFKIGAMKDGKIVSLIWEMHFAIGDTDRGVSARIGSIQSHLVLYGSGIPNIRALGFNYRTNSMVTGPSRSNAQQEHKWAWESVMDEMAEALGMDPIDFRSKNMSRPGTKLATNSPLADAMWESNNAQFFYSDSFASVEVLQEGAKTIGWDKRNSTPGGAPGRFKKGIGLGMSQHHAGNLGYHEGEAVFEKIITRAAGTRLPSGAGNEGIFNAEIELNGNGNVITRNGQPESGTNHDTAMATLIAEMLGFTSLDRIRVVWGDSELTPPTPGWHSGYTTMLQGGALCSAADKLKKDLLQRAANALKVDAAKLQMRDGVISSTDDPKKRITFAALAGAATDRVIRQSGRCVSGRGMAAGIGTCFAEVAVDTWTGDWKFLRAAYCTDAGNVINPLLAESDMEGSLIQSAQMTTDAIPYDREFPGTRHYSVGYLSYRLPTIMDVPEQTQVFVNSLEPRWFFGIKGMAETTIGSVPGALANAIYNACGVRIREHPITREKIMAGLKTK